jgi:hypothetical protein
MVKPRKILERAENMYSRYTMTQLSIGDLDGLLGFLYKAIYDRETDYTNVYTDITNLRIEDYLLFDYDLSLIFEATPIRYIGTRPTGIKRMINGEMTDIVQQVFKRKGKEYRSMINIVPYEKESDMQDLSDPVNINCIMRKIGSEQVTNHRTTKFILPIVNIAVKGSDLEPYPKVFSHGIDPNMYYCIQITEKYNDMMSLQEFITRFSPLDFTVIRSIIHQVIDIIYRMTEAYKNFRHHSFFPSVIQCYHYTISGVTYPELKLTDYFTASVEGSLYNKYQNPDITDYSIRNNYADLYQMMNNLWNTIRPDIEKHKELVELFDVFLPREIRSTGKSLTPAIWQSIDEETQHDMRIRNLRLNRVLTGREAIILGDFINQEEEEQEGGSELELTDDELQNGGDLSDEDDDDDEDDENEDDDDGDDDGDDDDGDDDEDEDDEDDGDDDDSNTLLGGETDEEDNGESDVEGNGELTELVDEILGDAPDEDSTLGEGRVDDVPEPGSAGGASDNEVQTGSLKDNKRKSHGIVPMHRNSMYEESEDQREDEVRPRRPVVVSSEGKPKILNKVRGSRQIYKFKPSDTVYESVQFGNTLARPHVDPYYAAIMNPQRPDANYQQQPQMYPQQPPQIYPQQQPTYNSIASVLGHPGMSQAPPGYQQQAIPSQQPLPPQISQEDYMRALAQSGSQAGGRPFFFPQQ